MFTHLFDQFVSGVGIMPGFMVYGIAGLWIGAENLGIPLPLELMLLFSGSLIALGELNVMVALGTLVLAGLTFALLAYFIGRHAGAAGVLRLGRFVGLSQRRIDHIDTWLRERGAVGVIFARIMPGIRLFGSYVMGVAGISPAIFAIGTLIGTASYFTIWLVIGAVLGPSYRVPLRVLDALGLYGVVLVVVILAAIFVVHQLLGRRNLNRLAAQHAVRSGSLAAAGNVSSDSAMPLVSSCIRMLSRDAATRLQSSWTSARAATARAFRSAESLDHRLADTVGLRGPDLQAQVGAPWPSWTIALVSAIWAELATAVLIMSLAAHRYATFPIDSSLAAAVQTLGGTLWARLIYPAGDLQWYLPTTIAYVIIFGTLLVLRLFLAAICTALASFGTDVTNVFINVVVARPRPHSIHITTLTGGALGSTSFPSGHVAHTMGLYGFVFFLCILAMRTQPRLKPWLFAIQAVCLYFILFVGASRVLEGQHWPSDVAGGYLVGLFVLAFVIVLYHVVAMRGGVRQGDSAPMEVGRPSMGAAVIDP